MGNLQSKRALVTGSGQGLGRAIAMELIQQGCSVAVHYHRSADGAQSLKEWAPQAAKVSCFQADLTSEVEAKALVDNAVDFLGGLDILINNTGDLIGRCKVEDLETEFWQRVINVNVTSTMLVTRYAVAHLVAAKESSIVNLASLAGRMGGHPGSLAYSTAKGAILTWTRALAKELGPRGVRVNAIAPGLILGTAFHNTHTTTDSANASIAGIPLGRAGTPKDVARAVAFLASEYDGFISGATIDINGGVFGC